jgi:hypothetical protein
MNKQEFIDAVKADHLSRWEENVKLILKDMGDAAYTNKIKQYVDLSKRPVDVSPRVMFELLKELAIK